MTREARIDLYERNLNFAIQVRDFIKQLEKDISNTIYSKQVIRSSSSIGANYIESRECLGRKDMIEVRNMQKRM